jgi:hypothetical protein
LTSPSVTIASSGTTVTAALVGEFVVFAAGVVAVGVITIGEAVEVTGKLVGGTLGNEVIGELVVEVDGERVGATVGVDEVGALVGNEIVGEMVGEILGAIVGLDVVGEIVGGKVYGFLSASKAEPFTAMVTSVPLTVNSKL